MQLKQETSLIENLGSRLGAIPRMSSSVVGMSTGGGSGAGGSSGYGGTSGEGAGGSCGPCGACKFLRRKCIHGCIFAPYFDSEQGAVNFAVVHKVFGASNVSKLLLQIPPQKRLDAVSTISYEAQMRLRDPVYGCVSHIFALQQQVANLQAELSYLQAHLATVELPSPPPFVMQHQMPMTTSFSVSNLPASSSIPSTLDLSTLIDPQMESHWAFEQQQIQQQQQQLHQQHYVRIAEGGMGMASSSGTTQNDELQSLVRELLNRHGQVVGSMPAPLPPCTQ
ncbi:hypothetical protein ACP70R_018926 [Stipagrostis hirtigluma subsp. patula]